LLLVSTYCNKAFNVHLLQEGVSPKDLDKKTKAIGFPVGTATLVDEVGIDVAAHIADYLSGAFGPRFGFGSNETSLLKDLVAQGYLGMLYISTTVNRIQHLLSSKSKVNFIE